MLSPVSRNSLLVLALGAAASCKPVDAGGSRILESGGTAVEWKVKTLVTSTGGLTLEKNGTGATDEAATINQVDVEVSSAPDALITVTPAAANQWIPLSGGTTDLKFNVLMTTRNLGLCYVNAVALNGSNDTVMCKSDAVTTANPNEPKRAEMERVCVRLSKEKVPDGAKPEDVFAKYDEKLNKEKCTCLNGKARDLFFGDYFAKTQPATELEADCRKKLEATDTSTDTSTAVTYEEFQKLKAAKTETTTETSTSASTTTGKATTSGTGTETSTTSATGTSTTRDSEDYFSEDFLE